MSLLEPSYATTAGHEYSNLAETQEKDLKTNYRKMMELLKEKMNESLKEFQENTNTWRKWTTPLKKLQNTNKDLKRKKKRNTTVQVLKMEIEAIKKTQTDKILGAKILEIQIGTTEESFSNRIQV